MLNGGRAMGEQQYFLADVYDNNGFLLAEKGNSANKSLIERLDNKNIKYKVGSFDDLRANSVKKSKVETKPDPKLSTSRFFEPANCQVKCDTSCKKTSIADFQPRHFRGLELIRNRLCISSISFTRERSVFLG